MSVVWTDVPLNSNHFAIEIKGLTVVSIGSVEGLQLENETTQLTQMSAGGKQVQVVALGKVKLPGELTLKRMAPNKISDDPFWKWITDIRNDGSADKHRKDGSVVIYDFKATEVSRWNFFGSWPSKISQDGVDASKNDLLHETITLQYDKLERHS